MTKVKEILESFGLAQKALLFILLALLLVILSLLIFRNIYFDTPKSFDGIEVGVLERGEGEILGDTGNVVISYAGFLEDGTEFDRRDGFEFTLGDGTVLKAWELGMSGMRVGGTRRISIEPKEAYGESGIPGLVPPNSKVIFEIKLLQIK